MKKIRKIIGILNDILEYELAGVVKYTHFALMVTGPNRLNLINFLISSNRIFATCSTGRRIINRIRWTSNSKNPNNQKTNQHSVRDLLTESLHHEEKAISLSMTFEMF